MAASTADDARKGFAKNDERRGSKTFDKIDSVEMLAQMKKMRFEKAEFLKNFVMDAGDLVLKTALTILTIVDITQGKNTVFNILFAVMYLVALTFTALSNYKRSQSLADLMFVAKHGYSKKWTVKTREGGKGGLDPRLQRDADFRALQTRGWRTTQCFVVDVPWFLFNFVRLVFFAAADPAAVATRATALLSMGMAGAGIGLKIKIVEQYFQAKFIQKKKKVDLYEVMPADLKCASAASENADTVKAMEDCVATIQAQVEKPSYVLIAMTSNHDHAAGLAKFRDLMPGVPYSGSTTCWGVLQGGSSRRKDQTCVGLFAIQDDEGFYEPIAFPYGADTGKSAADATQKAVTRVQERFGKIGRANGNPLPLGKPSVCWTNPSPGTEDVFLEAISATLPYGTPAVGGSSADNAVEGKWKQWASNGPDVVGDGIICGDETMGGSICIMWCTADVRSALFTGYNATAHSGTVTKLGDNARHLMTISDKPAADMYDQWTGGALKEYFDVDNSNILGPSSLYPIGQRVGSDEDGLPYFRVCHPHLTKKESKSFTLFADLKIGEDVTMMSGTPENLVMRIAQVGTKVISTASWGIQEARGAMVIFCGGCMMYSDEKMPVAAQSLEKAIGGIPHLGMHTFGEQGPFPDGKNCHGNLMFSAVVFSSKRTSLKVLNMDTGETCFQDGPGWEALVKTGALDEIFNQISGAS